ncbi:DUF4112 domain-containing protein [Phenylobacterium sp.]|jgi:hypothetical protein|uniref:DUF4112 domain-containing protein n=1 Tax=Phenylobacterium sp. TaxID=1871053 RepID=UPI002F95AAB4
MDVTQDRAHRAWRIAERIRRLSDRIVGVGPIGLGLDGVLAWVPGAGTVYSVGAAGLLIHEAIQAGASKGTLIRMGAYLAADSASSTIWLVGSLVDTLFPGHLMAARALQKDIEKRFGKAEMPKTGLGLRRTADPDVVDLPQTEWQVRR